MRTSIPKNTSLPVPSPDGCYPAPLRAQEDLLIQERRASADVATDQARIGLALSGGGIRSATFCLGVLQAFAGRQILRRIDFLSTVSGGGYAGSFLGRMFTRNWISQANPK